MVISLINVSKCYKRYAHPADRLKEILLPKKIRAQEFWALRNINLEVSKGETLGLIGRNGSGKSTLLQIIAGTLTPTTGTVDVKGRVSALLELGSGFNPEFTGRQNVFLNGRILGLTQKQIEDKFDRIVAFADIGDFLDEPVKTYSSGMFVRLAFAVAIHVEPEILIVDEALAVGDIFFQQKCFKFLENLRSQGTAILFVSHDTQAILNLCDRGAILQNGCLTHSGVPSEIVPKYTEIYYSQFTEQSTESKLDCTDEFQRTQVLSENGNLSADFVQPTEFIYEFDGKNRFGREIGLIAGIAIAGSDGKRKSTFVIDEEIILSVKINPNFVTNSDLNIGFQIKDRLGQIVVGTNTHMLSVPIFKEKAGSSFICQFKFKPSIAPKQYTVDVAIAEDKADVEIVYDWINNAGVIDVIETEKLSQVGLCFPKITVVTA